MIKHLLKKAVKFQYIQFCRWRREADPPTIAALAPLAEPGAEQRVKQNTDTKDSVMVADPEPEPRYELSITQLGFHCKLTFAIF